jgi:hypothetical protein
MSKYPYSVVSTTRKLEYALNNAVRDDVWYSAWAPLITRGNSHLATGICNHIWENLYSQVTDNIVNNIRIYFPNDGVEPR